MREQNTFSSDHFLFQMAGAETPTVSQSALVWKGEGVTDCVSVISWASLKQDGVGGHGGRGQIHTTEAPRHTTDHWRRHGHGEDATLISAVSKTDS